MTTLNLQVGASDRDAFENNVGVVSVNGTTIILNNAGAWVGFGFTGVTISPGDTINSATLQFYITTTSRDDNEEDVYGEAADNSAAFVASANNISNRSRTTEKVTVSADSVGVGFYSVTGLVSVIQAIIDRAGWANGNALSLILDGLTGVNIQPDTWDNNPSQAAKLDIDYTAASTGKSQPIIRQQSRQVPIAHLRI